MGFLWRTTTTTLLLYGDEELAMDGLERDISLYLVTQTEQVPAGSSLERVVDEAIQGGVTLVQLREKDADTRTFVKRAKAVKRVCDARRVPLLINDRIDVALAVGAAGVHVGQDDMPIGMARKLLPEGSIVGVSAGTVEEALEAARAGADYLGVGAVWATGSKAVADDKVLGPRGVKKILDALLAECLETPVVVIGGINSSNIARTLHGCVGTAAGRRKPVDGVAVVSAIMASSSPEHAAASLARSLSSFRTGLSNVGAFLDPVIYRIGALLSRLKGGGGKGGVVHHITNTVVQNDCANYTLALRSSPIMSANAEEAIELAQLQPGSLILNLGTLTADQTRAMVVAGQEANRIGKGVICDPVAAGASSLRKRETFRLLNLIQMTILKGNMGEIATIAGETGASSRGVDSAGSLNDPARVVRDLARTERCIVVMTGKTDWISDGHRTFKLENGVELLGHITGSGCMTGSSIGCFVAAASAIAAEIGQQHATDGLMVRGDMLAAAIAGVTTINVAAELAVKRAGAVRGPNSFRSALIDEVFALDSATLEKHARISEV